MISLIRSIHSSLPALGLGRDSRLGLCARDFPLPPISPRPPLIIRIAVGFWVGLRARDFPTERVLSRTPLIIRTARCSGRSRGAGTRRWTACSTARRRRMRVTRSTAASWMTLPTTPAFPMPGTPVVSEERSKADPAVAPKHYWSAFFGSAPCLRALRCMRDAWHVRGSSWGPCASRVAHDP